MNNIQKPIVLLIPAFNRQNGLERALVSLEQELHLLDIVVVDDGSTPPVHIGAFSHYPIHLIRLPKNQGIVAALNAGLEYIYARDYEFIARLDSDDVVINRRFIKQLTFLRAHPDIGLVGSLFEVVDSKGDFICNSLRPLEDRNIRKAMHLDCVLQHPTLMMRTEIARKTGFYNQRYNTAEDYDFYWRMLEITKVANMPDFLIKYAIGVEGSISREKRLAQTLTALRIKLRHFSMFNIYAYIGLLISLLQITDTFKYTVKIRKAIMDRLFPE